jgi:hypothetical protein
MENNNDNDIVSDLEKFDKPEKKFIEDKECLICLESVDLESNKRIVKLPCGCANSVYHTACIIRLLYSGENKNFCPHCKTKYEIPSQQVLIQETNYIPVNIYVQLPNLELQRNEINEFKVKTFTHIIIFHIITNSIMNVMNIAASSQSNQYNSSVELNVLVLFYFAKLFFNYCILMFSKNNLEKIDTSLTYSYVFQLILFGFLIYSFTKIKKDYYFIILLFNNIVFIFGDLLYRKIIENRMNTRVNIIG